MKKKKKKTKGGAEKLTNPLIAEFLDFAPKKGDLRRAKILEAAIQCLSTIGVENTNFESIGQEAEMIRAHVQYYYKDRKDIVKAAIQFVIATGQHVTVEYVKKARSAEEILPRFVEGTFEWVRRYPEQIPLFGLLYYYGAVFPEWNKINTDVRFLGRERISTMIAPLMPGKSKAQISDTAQLLQAILTGYIVEWESCDVEKSLDSLCEKATKYVSWAVLHGPN